MLVQIARFHHSVVRQVGAYLGVQKYTVVSELKPPSELFVFWNTVRSFPIFVYSENPELVKTHVVVMLSKQNVSFQTGCSFWGMKVHYLENEGETGSKLCYKIYLLSLVEVKTIGFVHSCKKNSGSLPAHKLA